MINERGDGYDDIVLDLFNSILSGKNEIVNRFIEHSKDNWKVGVDLTHDDLICQSVAKYNNMAKQDRWKVQEPNDVKIVALTTLITNLEKTINDNRNSKSLATGDGSSKNYRAENKFTLDVQQIKFDGNEKIVDGVKFGIGAIIM